MQHKISAYSHMLNRLNIIPMDKNDYNEELHTIIHIAIENGFTEKLIHKLNNKIKHKIWLQHQTTMYNTEDDTKKYITLPYNKNTSHMLNKIFKKHKYTIAYRTNQKLIQKLRAQQNNECDSGVYKLTCNDCSKFYIGQTGRTFMKRFNEHVQELRNAHTKTIFKSNYAQHLFGENHTYTNIDTNLKVIHRLTKSDILDRFEEIEIYKNRYNDLLLNDKTNTRTNKLYDLLYSR